MRFGWCCEVWMANSSCCRREERTFSKQIVAYPFSANTEWPKKKKITHQKHPLPRQTNKKPKHKKLFVRKLYLTGHLPNDQMCILYNFGNNTFQLFIFFSLHFTTQKIIRVFFSLLSQSFSPWVSPQCLFLMSS